MYSNEKVFCGINEFPKQVIRLNTSRNRNYKLKRLSENDSVFDLEFVVDCPLKMKFALFVALLAIGVSCMVAEDIISWGDVHRTKLDREIRVNAPYAWFRVQNRTVTYRTVSKSIDSCI